ncbi:MAG: hypothetical protein ACI9HK_003927 [Pirellulaceae bacterium]|jgi:hypothetical protein
MVKRTALGVAVLLLAAAPSYAQTVQLPTFQQFSASTTVSVPDRGSVHIGGVNSIREGSSTRGVPFLSKIPGVNRLFKNNAIGREASRSNIYASATIISLDEMDEAVLSAARSNRAGSRSAVAIDPALQRQAAFLSSNVGRGRIGGAEPALVVQKRVPDAYEIRQQNKLAEVKRNEDAWKFINQGKSAEKEGKRGVAKIYYQMASRRTSGDLQKHILARIDYLNSAGSVGSIAAK